MGGDGDLIGTAMSRTEIFALGDVSSQSQDSQDDRSLKCESQTQAETRCRKNKSGSSRFCRQHAGSDPISDDDDDSTPRHSDKKRRISSSNDSDDNTTASGDDSDYDELLGALAPLTTLRRGAISAAEELASVSTTWDTATSELPLCAAIFKDLQAIAESPAAGSDLFSTLLDNLLTLPTIAEDVRQNGIINSMVGFPRVAIVMSYLRSMSTDSLEAICLAAGISEKIPHATHQQLADANKWLPDQYYRDLLETFLTDMYDRALETKKTDGDASPWEAVSLFERLDGLSPKDLGVFLRNSKSELLARKAAKRKKRADDKKVEEKQRVQGLNPLGVHRPTPPSSASSGDGKPAVQEKLTFCTNTLLEKMDLTPLQKARASAKLAGVPATMAAVADIEQTAECSNREGTTWPSWSRPETASWHYLPPLSNRLYRERWTTSRHPSTRLSPSKVSTGQVSSKRFIQSREIES